MPETTIQTPPSTNTPTPPPQAGQAAPSPPVPVDWASHIPKEYAGEKVWESFKGKPLADVLKSTVEAQKLVGGSIRLPKPDAKPEERSKALADIYNKLGRPESADKYDVGEVAVPPNVTLDPVRIADIKSKLHAVGLTNEQAKAVFTLYGEELKTLFPDNTVVAAQSRDALIKEFGSESLFQRNISMGQAAINQYGSDNFTQWLESSGAGNDPEFIKFAAKIGRELVEHGAIEPGKLESVESSSAVQKKIDAMMNDKTDVYHSRPGTPGRAERIKEVSEWFKIVAGEA